MTTQTQPFPGEVVFGGPLSPVGWTVGFVEAPLHELIEAMDQHRRFLETTDPIQDYIEELRREGVTVGPYARGKPASYRQTELGCEPILKQLARLDPLQSPSMRKLVVALGDSWTSNFTNDHLGGDPLSWVSNMTERLNCRGVVATHIPRSHYSYPTTMFALYGRGGEPFNVVRTISAGVFDEGRWQFETSGDPQPFEDVARYEARLIRERFDRELLLEYLAALGIDADDPGSYGDGVLFKARARWGARTSTIAKTQREYGIARPAG